MRRWWIVERRWPDMPPAALLLVSDREGTGIVTVNRAEHTGPRPEMAVVERENRDGWPGGASIDATIEPSTVDGMPAYHLSTVGAIPGSKTRSYDQYYVFAPDRLYLIAAFIAGDNREEVAMIGRAAAKAFHVLRHEVDERSGTTHQKSVS